MSSGTKVANQDQHARSATRPQRPAPPGPLKPTRARRRPALIALGLALVALSVLAVVYLTTMLGQTFRVLAVAQEIPRGTVIEAGDLTVAELPTGPSALESISADELDLMVGKIAATDLSPGQLLTEANAVDELGPPTGQSIVGVALAPSQMPITALRPGDAVRVVETPATGGEPPTEAPFSIAATVIRSEPSPLGDQMVVDVQVTSNNAAALAARAATGRVAIVIDAVGAG
ncbi:SAF domain-containing protein [Promicromonospora panici]|uniref:SAF domain-containing protein n=1 Tax=Promicromonospora panici TaxID=2219658 RepID=UPI0013ECA82B|nr:SAF domain-containing protein [Promicromonospora panici]